MMMMKMKKVMMMMPFNLSLLLLPQHSHTARLLLTLCATQHITTHSTTTHCAQHTQAMSMGLPVISTNWSGITAYLDSTVGYPIKVGTRGSWMMEDLLGCSHMSRVHD